MPSGVWHLRLATGGALVALGASFYLGYLNDGYFIAPAMIIGEAMLSGDLDGAQSSSKRRWRKIGLAWIFKPVERLKHRSIFSHGPVIADALRLLYLGSILTALFFLASTFYLGLPGAWIYTGKVLYGLYLLALDYRRECFDIFAGLSAATAIHSCADIVVSEGKKMVD